MIVFKIMGFANNTPCPVAGQYLKSFDFEARDGRGEAVFTTNIAEAIGFETSATAFAFYKTVPMCNPTRHDGMPNRPMTSSNWLMSTNMLEAQNDENIS